MKIGILPLARPTFDVPFAEENLSAMLAALDATGHELTGPRKLLFDGDATDAAIKDLQGAGIDVLLLMQVTFTDASMTVAAANAFDTPIGIWAIPEPRIGDRLRLNSFCGLNLASHALGLNNREFSWLYADPTGDVQADLAAMFAGDRVAGHLVAKTASETSDAAKVIVSNVTGRRIARLGEHPVGFDTCAYDDSQLKALAGVEVDALALDDLFEAGRQADAGAVATLKEQTQAEGLDQVDQTELDRSLRLKLGLDAIRAKGDYSAFAIRCWPETFTEYGGAVCGPVSMMGEARVPCACEADVYGALTQMMLQEASGEPVFLTDLVDMDTADNTGVVWHCGQAPLSMLAEGDAALATIHTNRKMPLLYEFPLKPGRVTFMRISQSFGEPKMVLAAGEMLERPKSFTGTSGVVRFDRPASDVLNDVMDSGLEHHMALAYGEHRPLLRQVAAEMGLPVLEL
jgi:L-fucose isomerase-like protein